ncbi:hypothetical protein EfmE980_1546 [Enterococcus faecium E980]|nr:hypothetical protein EfmE980_1546 [Enterococcus faecium E980]MBL4988562.1 hypothetical protein [Enterococcus lactis]MBL4991713.1 hypothetical protein [Enterococcus lactis]SJX70732.1 hypothetical protein FM130_08440 [Enterococcus faecium]
MLPSVRSILVYSIYSLPFFQFSLINNILSRFSELMYQ